MQKRIPRREDPTGKENLDLLTPSAWVRNVWFPSSFFPKVLSFCFSAETSVLGIGCRQTSPSRGSSNSRPPTTPGQVNTKLLRDPSGAFEVDDFCPKWGRHETKASSGGSVCLSCVPGVKATWVNCGPLQVLALGDSQGEASLDFYTAPDCWKISKSDVFNKYPKYIFLAPSISFFLFNRKTRLELWHSFHYLPEHSSLRITYWGGRREQMDKQDSATLSV